ncbi:phage baseplate assembly protein V [Methyloversatilis sp.]|uniref:phage baseplate assembly protein V n=1 Tax=Methyloversatilis sp. TaxID=2569862 RepID=UPI0027326B5E|nr:phage baseplate assembly protein V [Methyloversatilis sp.]MDP3579140.1 phage baseplate assembly protein V [Methyloversatilis sp.]
MHTAPTPDVVELARRLDNLIRPGTVHSVNHAEARCRVQSGELVSDWLPWLAPRAGTTREWSPPTVGEQVLLLCPSGDPGAAWVLPAAYSDARPAPSDSASEHLTIYPDGAAVRYNHSTGALSVTGVQTAVIQAEVQVTIDAPHTHVTGTLTVDDLLSYHNGIAGDGGENDNLINGTFSHAGGTLSSNGIVLHTHTHTGVQPGSGNTGGPT